MKINGSNDEMLRAAAEQFGGKEREVISHFDPFYLCRTQHPCFESEEALEQHFVNSGTWPNVNGLLRVANSLLFHWDKQISCCSGRSRLRRVD